jgi:hypothetical protein
MLLLGFGFPDMARQLPRPVGDVYQSVRLGFPLLCGWLLVILHNALSEIDALKLKSIVNANQPARVDDAWRSIPPRSLPDRQMWRRRWQISTGYFGGRWSLNVSVFCAIFWGYTADKTLQRPAKP